MSLSAMAAAVTSGKMARERIRMGRDVTGEGEQQKGGERREHYIIHSAWEPAAVVY